MDNLRSCSPWGEASLRTASFRCAHPSAAPAPRPALGPPASSLDDTSVWMWLGSLWECLHILRWWDAPVCCSQMLKLPWAFLLFPCWKEPRDRSVFPQEDVPWEGKTCVSQGKVRGREATAYTTPTTVLLQFWKHKQCFPSGSCASPQIWVVKGIWWFRESHLGKSPSLGQQTPFWQGGWSYPLFLTHRVWVHWMFVSLMCDT